MRQCGFRGEVCGRPCKVQEVRELVRTPLMKIHWSWMQWWMPVVNLTESRISWEMGLSACIYGIIFIMLIDVGWRPLLIVRKIPWAEDPGLKEMIQVSWASHHCSLLLDYGCSMASCFAKFPSTSTWWTESQNKPLSQVGGILSQLHEKTLRWWGLLFTDTWLVSSFSWSKLVEIGPGTERYILHFHCWWWMRKYVNISKML